MKNFTYFENEKGSYTCAYDVNGNDETIICVERSKKNAVEVCKRLNTILSCPLEVQEEKKTKAINILFYNNWTEIFDGYEASKKWGKDTDCLSFADFLNKYYPII